MFARLKSAVPFMVAAAIFRATNERAKAGPLLNGGFELETPNGIGSNTPDGWYLTGNAVNSWTGGVNNAGGITARSGQWFASFSNWPPSSSASPRGPSGVAQNVNTIAGVEYTLDFWYTATSTATEDQIKATWNGIVLMDLTSNGAFDRVWQHATFTVTGTGSDVLEFSGYSQGYNGVDDVTLTSSSISSPVPEPASMITLAAGAIGMLGFRMRKRKADAGLVA